VWILGARYGGRTERTLQVGVARACLARLDLAGGLVVTRHVPRLEAFRRITLQAFDFRTSSCGPGDVPMRSNCDNRM
jgi:hypothetical protein